MQQNELISLVTEVFPYKRHGTVFTIIQRGEAKSKTNLNGGYKKPYENSSSRNKMLLPQLFKTGDDNGQKVNPISRCSSLFTNSDDRKR